MMARCRSALNGFSQAVYIVEGVQEITDGEIWDPEPVTGAGEDDTA
jgi:hypothetical protein